ncbi:ornithine cyclodeaminase family protein [Aquabacterium sp.]|uniref:ornithine cyclodeaminase family protein n=1 Tax=Aquabacterium sp. TaxID=1872578 RepID=UPI00378488A1
MRHFTDAEVDALVDGPAAQAALREAFVDFAHEQAAVQTRVRTEAGGVKLSTLGAVLPARGVLGAKVYSTIAGRFNFVIVLFDAVGGQVLATFDAGALTRLRTAATTVLAAQVLARPDAARLAVYGLGVQGREHVRQLAAAYRLKDVAVHDPWAAPEAVATLEREIGVPIRLAAADAALAGADLIVTASRSTTPLFDGARIGPGSFVAAIGSSLPGTRELDDAALRHAACIAVDWPAQACAETGDLLLADPAALQGKLVALADVLAGRAPGRRHADEITLYKSVGIGLQDIALAGLAWRRAQAAAAP